MKTWQLGIDCRFWGIAHAGLGRYTRELVLAMLKQNQKSKIEFVLFFRKGEGIEDRALLKGSHIVEVNIPHYSLKEQLIFGRIVDKERLHLVHFPHFNVPILGRTPFVVTIHDLIKHFFKGRLVTTQSLPFYWVKHLGYRLVIGQAIKRSRHILVPSRFVKKQLSTNYPVAKSKIAVTYEGVAETFRQPVRSDNQNRLLRKYTLAKPFFIYTGSVYPFKDLPTLLRALKLLSERISVKPQLLLASGRDIFWERLQTLVGDLRLEKQVLLSGKISDEDMAGLYSQATAFVTASLMEGFGLPGLEAMAAGCPVLACLSGSMPEIYGKAASYFSPKDVEGLAQKMRWVLELPIKERQALIVKGLFHSAQFSWEKTAATTLNVYQEVLT